MMDSAVCFLQSAGAAVSYSQSLTLPPFFFLPSRQNAPGGHKKEEQDSTSRSLLRKATVSLQGLSFVSETQTVQWLHTLIGICFVEQYLGCTSPQRHDIQGHWHTCMHARIRTHMRTPVRACNACATPCQPNLLLHLPLASCGCAAAGKLLAKQPELKANFSRAQGAGSNAKANKVARFLPNPEANWGPRPKHGRAVKVCCPATPVSSHISDCVHDSPRAVLPAEY